MVNRIIDVNINRSIEALRVIEDINRFYFNDKKITRDIKKFRHDIIDHFKKYTLLPYRNIKNDKGKFLNTKEEFKKNNLIEVIQSNCKRLQESSRVLEEILKLNDRKDAGLFKQIRFFAYNLEKEMVLKIKKDLNLSRYIIVDLEYSNNKNIKKTIKRATIIQVKGENFKDRSFFNSLKKIKKFTDKNNIPLIITGRIDIAITVDADGVILGKKDLPPDIIRKKFFYDKIIGVTACNEQDIIKAIKYKVDYVCLESSDLKKAKQLYKKYNKKIPIVIEKIE